MKQFILLLLCCCLFSPFHGVAQIPIDLEGTVMVRLSDRIAGETSFYSSEFPNDPISLTRTHNLISYSKKWEFAAFGKVNGIAFIQGIPETGWTHEIALKPKMGYIGRIQQGTWDNGVPHYTYIAIYCDSWLLRVDDNAIIGAEIKYVCPFSPEIKAVNTSIFEHSTVYNSKLATWYLWEADTNKNGKIDRNEKLAVTRLGFKGSYGEMIDVSNGLEGLYEFQNLAELMLSEYNFKLGKDLTIVHSNLKKLTLSWTKVEHLDLSGCTALESIFIDHCDLKSIILPESIVDINIANNCLQSIDLCNYANIKRLVIFNNDLTTLDVSCLPKLEVLSCENNNLTILDVSKNQQLIKLYCSDNQIQRLDISANPSIEILSVARSGHENSVRKLYIPTGKTKRDYKGSESGELSWFAGIEVINK